MTDDGYHILDAFDIDQLQARYDRKCAHRRRAIAYYDECPDGDPRKLEAEREMRRLSDDILDIERAMDKIIDAAIASGDA